MSKEPAQTAQEAISGLLDRHSAALSKELTNAALLPQERISIIRAAMAEVHDHAIIDAYQLAMEDVKGCQEDPHILSVEEIMSTCLERVRSSLEQKYPPVQDLARYAKTLLRLQQYKESKLREY